MWYTAPLKSVKFEGVMNGWQASANTVISADQCFSCKDIFGKITILSVPKPKPKSKPRIVRTPRPITPYVPLLSTQDDNQVRSSVGRESRRGSSSNSNKGYSSSRKSNSSSYNDSDISSSSSSSSSSSNFGGGDSGGGGAGSSW